MDTLNGLQQLLHEGVSLQAVRLRLWATRWRTLILVLGSAGVAVGVSFIVPAWYQSGATIVVDAGQNSLAATTGVLGFAAQLGLAGGTGQSSPQFYSDLLESRSLHDRLITTPLPLGTDGRLETLDQFWSDAEKPTPLDHQASLEKLARHFAASANPHTSAITFAVDAPSRSVAKLMADTTLAALNDLIISIRRRRASAEREFVEGRWDALGDSLKAHEDALRAFYERNRSITSPQLQFEEIRLKREVDRVEAVYSQVGGQLEQARIQEVRDTPALTVIDAPVEPVKRSFPRRRIWAFTAALLGAAVALLLAMSEAAATRLQTLRVETGGARRAEPT
jgi:uncharacterized protein involved in exopolysaccharide biosynthesis